VAFSNKEAFLIAMNMSGSVP